MDLKIIKAAYVIVMGKPGHPTSSHTYAWLELPQDSPTMATILYSKWRRKETQKLMIKKRFYRIQMRNFLPRCTG